MKTIRKVNRTGEIPRIESYRVPDVGDKIRIEENGEFLYCVGVMGKGEYEVSESWEDRNDTVVIIEKAFSDGVLTVVAEGA